MDDRYRSTQKMNRRVLVVEDEFVNREMLGFIMSAEYEVLYAQNGIEALDQIRNAPKPISIILLDLNMPQMGGMEFLKVRQEEEALRQIPVVVLTAENREEVRCLQLGADDFIPKPYDMPDVILARVWRIIEQYESRQIIQSTQEDTLTGLYTKEYFFEYIRRGDRIADTDKMDAVMLRIDHYLMLLELYGRNFGNKVLRQTADILRQTLEETGGIGCRAGEDLFYLYLSHQESYDHLLHRVQAQLDEISKAPRIHLQVGVYPLVDRSLEMERWFDRANLASQTIQGDQSRDIAFYDTAMHEQTLHRERLINDFHKAIAEKQFIVYYQPKYDITGETPRLCSAEALIRWKHPQLGMVSPGDFIPLFEKNGLIQELDYYVWREAGRQICRWREAHGLTLPVSVNVSRIDAFDAGLKEKLLGILEENGLTSSDLMLEVTESAYEGGSRQLIEAINSLRAEGFKVEMDDFGSGYSSLNMLTILPIDVLKLDMVFVRNMLKDEKSLRMVHLIMDIARFLNVPVVAEGVEDEEQCRLLKEAGCQVIQGFYFSRPLPPEDFENLF